jgi:hypothetical protein
MNDKLHHCDDELWSKRPLFNALQKLRKTTKTFQDSRPLNRESDPRHSEYKKAIASRATTFGPGISLHCHGKGNMKSDRLSIGAMNPGAS